MAAEINERKHHPDAALASAFNLQSRLRNQDLDGVSSSAIWSPSALSARAYTAFHTHTHTLFMHREDYAGGTDVRQGRILFGISGFGFWEKMQLWKKLFLK